jgi:hypothetical protein
VTEIDEFFTLSIVGAPFSVVLGRRRGTAAATGVEVPTEGGGARLRAGWSDGVVLPGARGRLVPRERPGRVRIALERHALWIAASGLVSLVTGAALLAWSSGALR